MEKYIEQRPWGRFERFCLNEKATVKLIEVSPNEELSLQYHHNRDEFWKVMEGQAQILIGDKVQTGHKGDEFFIPKETNHQIRTTDESATIMEISFGEFDEDDIVRLSDKYGRVQNGSKKKTV